MNLMASGAAPAYPPAPGYPSVAPAYSDDYPDSYPPHPQSGYLPKQHPIRSASVSF